MLDAPQIVDCLEFEFEADGTLVPWVLEVAPNSKTTSKGQLQCYKWKQESDGTCLFSCLKF